MSNVRLTGLACISVLFLLAPVLCRASAVTYVYTGHVFTSHPPPYTNLDSVSGSITLSSPLPANDSTLTDYSSQVIGINFTDGLDTINTVASYPGFEEFLFATSNGAITQWAIEVYGSNNEVGIGTVSVLPFNTSDVEDYGEHCSVACNGDNAGSIAFVQVNSGTWVTQSGVAPEPQTAMLLAIGWILYLGVAGVRRRWHVLAECNRSGGGAA